MTWPWTPGKYWIITRADGTAWVDGPYSSEKIAYGVMHSDRRASIKVLLHVRGSSVEMIAEGSYQELSAR